MGNVITQNRQAHDKSDWTNLNEQKYVRYSYKHGWTNDIPSAKQLLKRKLRVKKNVWKPLKEMERSTEKLSPKFHKT
jgi:hypothetical protein